MIPVLAALSDTYNFALYVVLMMIGFYGVIAKRNLIKQALGLGLFSTGIFLFYISMGAVEGGTAPVWWTTDAAHTLKDPGPYANPLTHVLILTAKDTVEDRVHGLRQGADDYLVKPFALEELLARVETLTRRTYQKRTSDVIVADLELDSAAKTVQRAGKSIPLAAREFALLEYLMLRKGQVVSRTEIEEHIYDDMVSPMSNVVDSAICSLRKCIAVDSDSVPLIHTRRGQGYVLEDRSK